jgi:hypothetical protein
MHAAASPNEYGPQPWSLAGSFVVPQADDKQLVDYAVQVCCIVHVQHGEDFGCWQAPALNSWYVPAAALVIYSIVYRKVLVLLQL